VCTDVWHHLSPGTQTALETLLTPDGCEPHATDTDGDETSTPGGRALLHELRACAGRATLENLFRESAKLERIRAVALPSDLFAPAAPKVVQAYRDRAAVEAPYELRRHPEPLRLTLLAAFCQQRVGPGVAAQGKRQLRPGHLALDSPLKKGYGRASRCASGELTWGNVWRAESSSVRACLGLYCAHAQRERHSLTGGASEQYQPFSG